jgi:hypothetical protein
MIRRSASRLSPRTSCRLGYRLPLRPGIGATHSVRPPPDSGKGVFGSRLRQVRLSGKVGPPGRRGIVNPLVSPGLASAAKRRSPHIRPHFSGSPGQAVAAQRPTFRVITGRPLVQIQPLPYAHPLHAAAPSPGHRPEAEPARPSSSPYLSGRRKSLCWLARNHT